MAVTPKNDVNPAIATNVRFYTSLLNVSLMAKDKQWVHCRMEKTFHHASISLDQRAMCSVFVTGEVPQCGQLCGSMLLQRYCILSNIDASGPNSDTILR